MIRAVLFVVGFSICSTECVAKAEVSADLLCTVQNAIRWQFSAWTHDECARVAVAMNATPSPLTTMAMAINESDLRPRVVVTARPGVHDVGLLGVRCVTSAAGKTARGYGPRSAGASKPVGLAAGRCLVGPARGYTLEQLQDPAVNVAVAARIMEIKKATHGKAWLRGYNGGTKEHGYADRIHALEAAIGGVNVGSKSKRVRELIRKIVAAIASGSVKRCYSCNSAEVKKENT